ncbi:MAG: barstar family protein [Planctomycetaceae bacterium]|nr:barstar family protein [Planctomycetaceae bacterium]
MNDELREQLLGYYLEFANSVPIKNMDPDYVPSELREYIPYAELWGESDVAIRARLLAKAPILAIKELAAIGYEIEGKLSLWSASSEIDSSGTSKEFLAFSAMKMAAEEATPDWERTQCTVKIDYAGGDKQEFLSQIGKQLHFPYFSYPKWEGFNDWLSSLDWFEHHIITMDHVALPTLSGDDLDIYYSILKDAVEYWHFRPEHKLILQFAPELNVPDDLRNLKS